MRKQLRYLLISLVLSILAVLFAMPNANATQLRVKYEKSELLKKTSYYVTINSLLGPNLILPEDTTSQKILVAATSQLLPEISKEWISHLVQVTLSVQQRIAVGNRDYTHRYFYSYRALQSSGDSALLFLSIIKQAYDITLQCRVEQPIVLTVYGNSILPISLLAGIESHLGFKTVYVNIIEKGGVISNEFGGGSWFCSLGPIRAQFNKVVNDRSVINVNIYQSLGRYAEHIRHIPGPTYGTKSDSFYIGSGDVEAIGKSLEAIGQGGRPLIAFDLEGNEIERDTDAFPGNPSSPMSVASTVSTTASGGSECSI